MTNKEIKHMLKHVEDKPQSEFGKFIFNTNNTAGDLIDFLMWVDNNNDEDSTDYDMLVQKYLQQLNDK